MRGFAKAFGKAGSGAHAPSAPHVQRTAVRYALKSMPVPIRLDRRVLEIRLKDLSTGGACGLISEPINVGDYLIVELGPRHKIEAQVRWVRRLLVGLQFSRPLAQTFVKRVHTRELRKRETQTEASDTREIAQTSSTLT